VENSVTELALFGEWSTAVSDSTTLVLGGRLSHAPQSASGSNDTVSVAQAFPGGGAARSDTFFLPAAALTATVSPQVAVYVRYQESFRPGGVSLFANSFNLFQHDRLRALESGLRYGSPGRGAFDASAALVYAHWSNLQADTIGPDGFPCAGNFGDGSILALDMSAAWRPLPSLSLDMAALISDTRLEHVDVGFDIDPKSPLPNVAWLNARAAATYRTSFWRGSELQLSAAARYAGKSYFGVGGMFNREQGDWLDVGLGARLSLGATTLSLNVSNLLDQRGNRFAFGSPTTLAHQDHITPLRPRTVRLGIQTRF
jgi:outer membrane receptor protein involved in Fe transport